METLVGNVVCPFCGGKQEMKIPTNACVPFYKCNACGKLVQAKGNDCCVFCSYGDRSCPLKEKH